MIQLKVSFPSIPLSLQSKCFGILSADMRLTVNRRCSTASTTRALPLLNAPWLSARRGMLLSVCALSIFPPIPLSTSSTSTQTNHPIPLSRARAYLQHRRRRPHFSPHTHIGPALVLVLLGRWREPLILYTRHAQPFRPRRVSHPPYAPIIYIYILALPVTTRLLAIFSALDLPTYHHYPSLPALPPMSSHPIPSKKLLLPTSPHFPSSTPPLPSRT